MINIYNQVPLIYSNASRDFQYLSWLFNIVLNSVKHNVDDIYDLPNSKADPKLIELLALTLGFKLKRNYDQQQLSALVSVLPKILKCKGTLKALEIACEALVKSAGLPGITKVTIQDKLVEVLVPKELTDASLLVDLIPYVLPAGLAFRIVRRTESEASYETYYDYQDTLVAKWYKDISINDNNDITGPTTLHNSLPVEGDLAFNRKDSEGNISLNVGLLDNTVIPVLENAIVNKTNQEDN